ncbi:MULTISPECIES: class I SAM-dependent methyltransferase [Luteimonas]|uniref:class I SAM-dependent methyltransferase n=1 Tax=Luteimonas TaxID=83614 RepID=UPI001303FC29|nr:MULTISPECIES: class I SAM-dependent methyltransferase [Luteimonas]
MHVSHRDDAGVDRTHGYCKHLAPSELRLAALTAGFAPAPREDFRYLELGFGHGVSVGFHAAATDGTYWGTDANPAHAARARSLAAASGARTHLSDDSFWEFAVRRDLPEFDYIALHGVWSWISDENRDVIVDLIRRKLAPGGIAYLSYDTSPGCAPDVPVRQLLSLFTGRGADADALQCASDVLQARDGDGDGHAAMSRHLDALGALDGRDRVQASGSADWTMATFSETAARLGGARLTFAGSTRLLDNVESFRLTPDKRRLLDRIDDRLLRETAKDFLTNARGRSDVYVKGGRPMADEELSAHWAGQRFVLTTHVSELPRHVVLPPGTIRLDDRVPGEVVAALAEDGYAPRTIAALCAHPRLGTASVDEVIAALLLLAGTGHASLAQTPSTEVVARCDRLNRHVCERARVDDAVEYLASPVTGGAIHVSRIGLLFLDAVHQGRDTVQGLTRYLRTFLQPGDTVRRDRLPGDARTAFEPMAVRFLTSTLPMLRALQAA